jgi:hypothetical protein
MLTPVNLTIPRQTGIKINQLNAVDPNNRWRNNYFSKTSRTVEPDETMILAAERGRWSGVSDEMGITSDGK